MHLVPTNYEFFMPGIADDKIDDEVGRLAGNDGGRFVYAIVYRHQDWVFEVTVGQRRHGWLVVPPKPDATRIRPLAGRVGRAYPTGATIYAIVQRRQQTYIFESADHPSDWANPTAIPASEILKVLPFAAEPATTVRPSRRADTGS